MKIVALLARRLPGRHAERMPMPTPISSQSAAAGSPSSRSTGTSAATMLLTGAPDLPTERRNDVPRSPWKIRLKYWTY